MLTDLKVGMEGYLFLGQLYSNDPEEAGTAIALLLTGQKDDILLATFNSVKGDEDSRTPEEALDFLKLYFRRQMRLIMNEVEKEVEKELTAEEEKRAESFYHIHDQSEHGTTAEIAQKLGVSKKQVRKMKAEGTLEDALKGL